MTRDKIKRSAERRRAYWRKPEANRIASRNRKTRYLIDRARLEAFAHLGGNMQLSPDNGTIESAIEELKLTLPVCALTNIIAERKRNYRPLGDLRRRLQLLRARQLVAEAAVD